MTVSLYRSLATLALPILYGHNFSLFGDLFGLHKSTSLFGNFTPSLEWVTRGSALSSFSYHPILWLLTYFLFKPLYYSYFSYTLNKMDHLLIWGEVLQFYFPVLVFWVFCGCFILYFIFVLLFCYYWCFIFTCFFISIKTPIVIWYILKYF